MTWRHFWAPRGETWRRARIGGFAGEGSAARRRTGAEQSAWAPPGRRTRACRRRCLTERSVFTQRLHREVQIINNCHVHSGSPLKLMRSDGATPLRSHSSQLKGKKKKRESHWKSAENRRKGQGCEQKRHKTPPSGFYLLTYLPEQA